MSRAFAVCFVLQYYDAVVCRDAAVIIFRQFQLLFERCMQATGGIITR